MDYKIYMENESASSVTGDVVEGMKKMVNTYFGNCQLILEIGSGTGWFLDVCKEENKQAIGIDINPGLVRLSKAKGLDIVKACATSMPFKDESFDGVFSIAVFEHFNRDELLHAVSEVKRVMKKGGRANITVPNVKAFGRDYFNDPTHVSIFTKKMAELLLNEFRNVRVEERYYIPKIKGLCNKLGLLFVHDALVKILPNRILKPDLGLYCTFEK